jgi:hypothetical protein
VEVLIALLPPPYVEGTTIWCDFVAIARLPNGTVPSLRFRVAYQFGLTLAQQRTGIINAATQAKNNYATAHGITFPAVNSIEILGI